MCVAGERQNWGSNNYAIIDSRNRTFGMLLALLRFVILPIWKSVCVETRGPWGDQHVHFTTFFWSTHAWHTVNQLDNLRTHIHEKWNFGGRGHRNEVGPLNCPNWKKCFHAISNLSNYPLIINFSIQTPSTECSPKHRGEKSIEGVYFIKI